jgi:flavin-dependent dehydrogenase
MSIRSIQLTDRLITVTESQDKQTGRTRAVYDVNHTANGVVGSLNSHAAVYLQGATGAFVNDFTATGIDAAYGAGTAAAITADAAIFYPA